MTTEERKQLHAEFFEAHRRHRKLKRQKSAVVKEWDEKLKETRDEIDDVFKRLTEDDEADD